LNHHRAFLDTDANQQLVTHPRFLAGFAALASAMDLAAFDRGLGQGTGLEETRRP
jgi:hypothetical protein